MCICPPPSPFLPIGIHVAAHPLWIQFDVDILSFCFCFWGTELSPGSSSGGGSGGASSSTGNNGPARSRDRNERGETAMHVAAIKGDQDGIKKLLEQGMSPNVADFAGKHDATPSHFLDSYKKKNLQKFLYFIDENRLDTIARGMQSWPLQCCNDFGQSWSKCKCSWTG